MRKTTFTHLLTAAATLAVGAITVLCMRISELKEKAQKSEAEKATAVSEAEFQRHETSRLSNELQQCKTDYAAVINGVNSQPTIIRERGMIPGSVTFPDGSQR